MQFTPFIYVTTYSVLDTLVGDMYTVNVIQLIVVLEFRQLYIIYSILILYSNTNNIVRHQIYMYNHPSSEQSENETTYANGFRHSS